MAGNIIWAGLAVDLGASSGRVMTATFDGTAITLDEAARFENGPVEAMGTHYWNILGLYAEIKKGIAAGINKLKAHGVDPVSVGIDTWGVDYGLLDKTGKLLGNPVHYRDSRTNGMVEKVYAQIPREEVFATTGLQTMQLNTLFQLASMKDTNDPQLDYGEVMLHMPDLFHYFLTGVKCNEQTIASTSQLYNPSVGDWAWDLIEKLGLPKKIFQKIVKPGTVVGEMLQSEAEEVGASMKVVAVGSHDTASAVAAVPAKSQNFAYLSCGTWSLLGSEEDAPVLSPRCGELNFTNEVGVEGKIRLLKNIMGLWLIQEIRGEWIGQGRDLGWADMVKMAEEAPAFACFIDPDDELFLAPGDMTPRVAEYCKRTGQDAPASDGSIVRTVFESLAMKYRSVTEGLEEITGNKIEALNIVGGGVQNKLLCQWTANALGRQVITGPVEATALGNVIAQLMADGKVANLVEGRKIIENSVEIDTYEPQDNDKWNEAYEKYAKIVK